MTGAPETFRVSLSPFRPMGSGIYAVVGALAHKGYVAQQFCLIGAAPAVAAVAAGAKPSSSIYPHLSHLASNVESVQAPGVRVSIVASTGPLSDVLLNKQSWLSSSVAAPLHPHLENGDVVLAVNGFDHAQFVEAAHLLLRHGDGNVLTHIFRWP